MNAKIRAVALPLDEPYPVPNTKPVETLYPENWPIPIFSVPVAFELPSFEPTRQPAKKQTQLQTGITAGSAFKSLENVRSEGKRTRPAVL